MKKVKVLGKMIPVFVLVLLGVGMVSGALLTYFGVLTQTVTVDQAVVLDGTSCTDNICTETTPTISGGETAVSGEYTLTSKTSVKVPVTLETTVVNETDGTEAGITSEIVGKLELTKKTVDFGNPIWIVLNEPKVQIEYTIAGNGFNTEVTSTPIEGYVLIYYKDNSDRFNEPAEAILVEGNSFPYLPYKTDRNSEEDGTYDYCATGEYDTCHGAKIWYVPSNAITNNELDWARANEFYFESSLIQYNADGEITIYPGEVLDFQVETTFSVANTGKYTVTTTVVPPVLP